ncbi:GNAT family N-acetyltransferase [Anaerobacillus sp. CMMVII]|uniref:GNAT family N-acetyltransferase n=1 Tax=Anaerobacillus sp. CMMVII TaxID=2755588 RepID=UPI0021B7383D|nr:GNAT family N-acetyltransferase [Anaerobacillus sp. CMMVII]MCT8137316.1 GNAT family N-acetyltransferase [Anaerobacillus sp. CMMVII]
MQKIIFVEIEVNNRHKFLGYLLLADESEEVVETYIHQGDMFSIYLEEILVGVMFFTFEPNNVVEIKNMAISPEFQGRGIGKALINEAFKMYESKGFSKMIVGTANSSISNLAFYQKAGFRMSAIKKNFFLQYPEPIIEDGIRAIDMVMFEKELGK